MSISCHGKFITKTVVLLIFCLSAFTLGAQKVEVEKRIKQAAFPAAALSYVQQHFPKAKRLKFYQETSADSLTYEAKFKQDGDWYSVEFTPEGQLLDIEKRVKFNSLPAATKENIVAFWTQNLDRFKVDKCQEQTSASGVRYEIEVKAKVDKKVAFYEYLFEADGTFIRKAKIILRPNDMTLY